LAFVFNFQSGAQVECKQRGKQKTRLFQEKSAGFFVPLQRCSDLYARM